MDTAQRRLKSISFHILQPENSFVHGIDSNLLLAFQKPPKSSPFPVVIGGMVLDIVAKPDTHPYPATTTPGNIEYVSGGVARNVVECMTKLGSKPFMISVVGFDMAGELLLKLWESAELPTEGLLKLKGISTPVVSNIFDCKGELFAGVASVHAVENFLSPDWIWKFKHYIYSAPILMVDANLHPESLEAACQIAAKYRTPVWFEPVSVTKSARIASIVDYITCASPNENELIAMANALSSQQRFSFVQRHTNTEKWLPSVQSLFDLLKPAILLLLERGIKLLIVTIGSDGVFVCFRDVADFLKDITMKNKEEVDHNRQLLKVIKKNCPHHHESFLRFVQMSSGSFAFHLPAPAASVVSLTGAGDCLVGGILSSLCSGLDIMQSAAVGVATAKEAVEAFNNVPVEISLNRIASETHKILSAAKQLMFDS
ncbi:uncharacterized protein LOC110107581 isoform X2 [Dendrobium catenatum]|uniref:uncharacterized protein LOC110107581 isoform X1 n=1 Tax=Dendrobium catenatum TaxID=906689 RepID=UPI0010A09279|nr:uncharacterized protein LOC110107581 isoform X1 [Dendrobium catenatum]XP_020693517.2 uncharacterized protein LOC110107581 isoform X2 [Dendrobium catenatum]